jgi:hypothetical protein
MTSTCKTAFNIDVKYKIQQMWTYLFNKH